MHSAEASSLPDVLFLAGGALSGFDLLLISVEECP